ncbi:MAG: hypothetical protein HY076_08035 [Candidatus Eisenbacteria bacterium]|uniref:T9SS type A sorting domain-containing protein n=1 Tax=Eiseniibacteriota bacterium TaxID=2212470 RepID=A0A9D6LAW8_UNCEI|nr:hypothetical protein [Candidatus Eisenbacteria bacterium]MBI3540205.1 hypothetical protein [Candidatus Eisenbacteria bacterium]
MRLRTCFLVLIVTCGLASFAAAAPNPTCTLTSSPASITIGQQFSIAIGFSNQGTHSDDGRISVSMPAFTNASDGQWVNTLGDPNQFKILPGDSLADVNCQPMTASCVTDEYRDNDWTNAETHYLTMAVRPLVQGPFYMIVRCTMHEDGDPPCVLVNGVPTTGDPVVDQQGFPARRIEVDVNPGPPIPTFPSPVTLPSTAVVGQPFTFTVAMRNDGVASDDGRISVAFPAFTAPTDSQAVSPAIVDGYSEYPAGSTFVNASCLTYHPSYLTVEYQNANWQGGGVETHTLTLTVTPTTVGTFYIDVRGALHVTGTAPCNDVDDGPSGGTANYGEQGWYAKRFAVQVSGVPPPPSGYPIPVFNSLTFSQTALTLGDAVTITASAQNYGPSQSDGVRTDDGRISIAFPNLSHAGDNIVGGFGESPSYSPGFLYYPVAASVPNANANCQPMSAVYAVAQFGDIRWTPSQSHTLTVSVIPPAVGQFIVEVRCTMHHMGGPVCDYVTGIPTSPPGGVVGTDQEGYPVLRYTLYVNPPPPPTKPAPTFASVTGIPSAITLGENFCVTATASNGGLASDDGRIAIEFPSLTAAGDAQWIDARGANVTPGTVVQPSGTTVANHICVNQTAGSLSVETRDGSWAQNTSHALAVTVQPQAVGPFDVYVRSTMHTAGGATCDYVNGLPTDGTSASDQQGWSVKKYTVQVQAPAEAATPPNVTWQRLTPSGDPPPARYGHAAVYDPVRDQMVLVAGNWGDCDIYNWALRFSPAPQWVTLPTFVGPGERTDERWHHSLIYDALDQQVVTYGGFCLQLKPDVMALDMTSPASWARALGSGTPPTARDGHAAVYDPVRNRMLVIGGYDGTSRNDVWSLSLPDMVWTQLAPGGATFPGREDHSAAYDPVRDRVIVFGGQAGNSLNDVWELRLSPALEWHPIFPGGVGPNGRSQQSMIYDPDHDRMIVFGGADQSFHSDLWALWLSGGTGWARLWSTNVGPSNRLLHTAVWDAARHRMVLYGGETGASAYSDEAWALSFDQAPVGVTPPVARAELALAGAAPNPAGARMEVAFALPDDRAARLELFDLGGRRVARRDVGSLGAGEHRVAFATAGLAPGVYLVRLTRAERVLTAKATVLK